MDTAIMALDRAMRHGLQWSHDLSAMDSACIRAQPRRVVTPSMEPRPLSHGYTLRPAKPASRPASFNGAMTSQPWIRQLHDRAGQNPAVPSMEP